MNTPPAHHNPAAMTAEIAAETLRQGQRIIAERGIDVREALRAYKSMHPADVADEILEMAFTVELAMIQQLRPPFTIDSIAQQIAERSGPFPWDGPVGNGLTLAEYRDKFRVTAADWLFLMEQHGLDTDTTGEGVGR